MKTSGQFGIVLVTCATPAEGRKIARELVSNRLAACVSIALNPVESFYTWEGKVEKTREYLLVIKTTKKRLADLEKQVKRMHSYEVPEFIVLPITAGSNDYLSWLNKSVMHSRK
ncbi:MAG TPA: divalent-cation tolerance protein CutA [Candidatus Acidoferrum sp.]|jgi:periplasmic divalent cation tolerance protein|nr:divalent-cation tolerance protein CutA [Candidatus Acidoferrum sp.]